MLFKIWNMYMDVIMNITVYKKKEKQEEKLDISISNNEIGFLNFLTFIAFAILVSFKSFVVRP